MNRFLPHDKKAANLVRWRILHGSSALNPISSEREMAAETGVDDMRVRWGLKLLEKDGLVRRNAIGQPSLQCKICALPSSRRERGVALVIVLAFVVLLTGLVVAYFSRSMADRLLSNSSFHQAKADQLARSAVDILTGNLRQEIVNGSASLPSPNPGNYPLVYLSTTNANMIPVRNGTPAWVSGTNPIPTLLRTSSTNAITLPGVDYAASGATTTGTSANGRTISAARWNKHYLIPLQTPGTPTNTTPIGAFTPPSWVFVTIEKGPAVLSSPTKDTSNNTVTPIGRYAYAIYDEGALLDVNAAGFPRDVGTSTMPGQYAPKGALAFADLTQLKDSGGNSLITQTGVNNLVGWRNYASMQNLINQPTGTFPTLAFSGATVQDTYKNLVLSNTNGFLKVSGTASGGRTDQPFLTRQELIDLAAATGAANFNPNALQYLGTFSRAVTAPSWTPTADSKNMSGYLGGAGTAPAPYKTNAENAASENRDIPNVRFSSAGSITRYADDGSSTAYSVKAGDQLLQRRFSLKRIDWLMPTGPAAGKATAIKDCFGLTWGSNGAGVACWVYNHGSPVHIFTLAEVATANREPDFFELLKAAILNGSLGRDPGYIGATNPNFAYAEVWGQQSSAPYNTPAGTNFDVYSSVPDSQIIQIGANIIDQYDSDSIPTAIYFNVVSSASSPPELPALWNTFFGIENLPYITSLRPISWRDSAANNTYGWFQMALWNPHQMPPTAPSAGSRPTSFRLHAYGASRLWDWGPSAVPGGLLYDPSPTTPNLQYITFSDPGDATSPFYNNPVFLTASTGGATSPNPSNLWQAAYGNPGNQFVGFFAGTYTPGPSGENSMIIGAAHPQIITIVAEYSMDGGATWKPYSLFSRYDAFCGGGSNAGATAQVQGNFDIARADPRTDRISTAMGWPGIGNNTYWPSSATVYNSTAFAPSKLRGFTFTYGTTPIAKFAVNQTATPTYYTDPDGVLRPGDAYLNNPPTGDGCPTFNGGTTTGRRPVILNRPFRSVGELGYVFRDLPFKSLDFWSSSSADGALLDLFGVNDNEPPVVAGQVDPNNAPAPVLQAIIAGTMKNESTSLTCSSSDAQTIAVQLSSKIGAAPLGNRADLAAAVSGAVNAAMAAVPDLRNKAYGETAVRSLSSVTNTRTWNLLIDVIAQSGSFTPGATDLSRGFAVQGERRYWLHIAIDRFTGKVVDQQLEPVYE